jgi:hypothetical protein
MPVLEVVLAAVGLSVGGPRAWRKLRGLPEEEGVCQRSPATVSCTFNCGCRAHCILMKDRAPHTRRAPRCCAIPQKSRRRRMEPARGRHSHRSRCAGLCAQPPHLHATARPLQCGCAQRWQHQQTTRVQHARTRSIENAIYTMFVHTAGIISRQRVACLLRGERTRTRSALPPSANYAHETVTAPALLCCACVVRMCTPMRALLLLARTGRRCPATTKLPTPMQHSLQHSCTRSLATVCIRSTHTHTHAHTHAHTCTHMHTHAHTHAFFRDGVQAISASHSQRPIHSQRPVHSQRLLESA